jgi:hypothetical protein
MGWDVCTRTRSTRPRPRTDRHTPKYKLHFRHLTGDDQEELRLQFAAGPPQETQVRDCSAHGLQGRYEAQKTGVGSGSM